MVAVAVEKTDPHWAIVSLSPDGGLSVIAEQILHAYSEVANSGLTTDGISPGVQ